MYTIYTDGGGNLEVGSSCACIINENNKFEYYSLYLGAATSNESELMSAILFLSVLQAKKYINNKEKLEVIWHSDSEYTLNSTGKYINKWIENSWKTSTGEEPKNLNILKSYLYLREDIDITSKFVPSHSGILLNDICDKICTTVRKTYDTKLSHTYSIFNFKSRKYKCNSEFPLLTINADKWLQQLRSKKEINLEISCQLIKYILYLTKSKGINLL